MEEKETGNGPITYSLASGDENSDQYYHEIARFTDSVLDVMGDIPVEGIMTHIEEEMVESLRTREEYLLDLLTMGTLLRVYGMKALLVADLPKDDLKRVARLRIILPSQRHVLDRIKGDLSTRLLSFDQETDHLNVDPTVESLHHLIDYLEATGEFDEECHRLVLWERYFGSLDLDEASNWIEIIQTTAEWFEHQSLNALGKYTEHVNRYLSGEWKARTGLEDIIFCGRRRVEYHLNMVGAEIMNRSFRDEFEKKILKVVLLPTCMSDPEMKCMAVEGEMGIECRGCTSSCIVNELRKMGEEKGFLVIMAAHGSSVMKDPSIMDEIGVLGVACVLNLLPGGWKARRMGVPAQCVLLDECGCRNHWDENGVPTIINIEYFKKIMGGF